MTSVRSRPGRLKAAIWLLLGLTVATAGFAASADTAQAEMPPAVAALADRGLSTYLASLSGGAAVPTAGALPATLPSGRTPALAPVALPAATAQPPATTPPTAAPPGGGAATDDLPAWRWRAFDLDADAGGWLGPLKQVPVIIAEFFFQIAMFIWQILLLVIRFGLFSEIIVRIGASPVNAGFAFIAGRLVFFIPLFFAVILWRVATSVLKGRPNQALRSGVIFVVAFAILSGMAYQAQQASVSSDPSGISYPGSPGWVGVTALDFGSKIAEPLSSLTSGLQSKQLVEQVDKSCQGLARTDSKCLPSTTSADVDGHFNCSYYTQALHNRYLKAPRSEGTLVVMSRLWENTFLKSWALAAFGMPGKHDLPNRAICHWAEEKAETPVRDRWAVAQAAAAIYNRGAIFDGADPYFVFGPFPADTKDLRKAITGFAACTNTGSGWTTHPAWYGLDDAKSPNKLDNPCKNAFKVPTGEDSVANNNDPEGFGDLEFYGGRVNDWTDGANREQLSEVRTFGLAFSGAGSSTRITQALLAVLVAVAFLLTLGFVGIGLFLASLMALTGLLLALPLAILALAFESEKAKALLRMTASSLMAKTMFTLLLSALILISGLFQALLTAAFPLPGPFKAFGYGLSPVLAMFIIRAVLKSVGMADLVTPSGALTFATSAAMKSSGNRRMEQYSTVGKDGRNSLQRGIEKSPMLGRAMRKTDRRVGGALTGNWATFGGRQRARQAKAGEQKELLAQRAERHAARVGFRDRIEGYRKSLDENGIARTFGRKLIPKANGGKEEALARLGTIGAVLGAAKDTVPQRRGQPSGEAMTYTEQDYVTGLEAKSARTGSTKTLNPHLDTLTDQIYSQLKRDYPDMADGAAKKKAREQAVAALVAGVTSASIGTDEPLSSAQIEQIRTAAAASLGYDRSEILVTANGIALPDAGSVGIRLSEATPEQLRNYVHWLPEHERQVQQIITADGMRNETEDEYAARLLGIGIARGMIGPDGRQVDVLALNGLDITNEATRERIRRWQEGEVDKLLDKLCISPVNSSKEARLIADLQAVTRRARTDADVAERSQWDERVTVVRQVVEQIPGKSQELTSAAAQTQQAVSAVGTARDLLQKARAGGDNDAVERAAERMDRSVENLAARFEALEEKFLEMRLNAIEAASMAAASTTGSDAGLERVLEAGMEELAREHRRLVKAASDVLTGAADLDDVSDVVDGVTTAAQRAAAEGIRRFTDEVINAQRPDGSTGRLTSASPRNSRLRPPKSARAEADRQGYDAIPEE